MFCSELSKKFKSEARQVSRESFVKEASSQWSELSDVDKKAYSEKARIHDEENSAGKVLHGKSRSAQGNNAYLRFAAEMSKLSNEYQISTYCLFAYDESHQRRISRAT
jgi:hypothetical protein